MHAMKPKPLEYAPVMRGGVLFHISKDRLSEWLTPADYALGKAIGEEMKRLREKRRAERLATPPPPPLAPAS
jgi:hypothetical protein